MAVNVGRLLWVGQPKHFLRIQGSGHGQNNSSYSFSMVLVDANWPQTLQCLEFWLQMLRLNPSLNGQ